MSEPAPAPTTRTALAVLFGVLLAGAGRMAPAIAPYVANDLEYRAALADALGVYPTLTGLAIAALALILHALRGRTAEW